MKEKIFWWFSRTVYRLDSKHKDYDSNLDQNATIIVNKIKFQILQTESNPTNGMQAMAVAPIKNNQVDTSEIVVIPTKSQITSTETNLL